MFEFDGALLQKAVRATFESRQTPMPQNLPTALTDNFAANPLKLSLWSGFITRNRIKTETDFAFVIKSLREFFAPIIEAESQNTNFNKHWKTGNQNSDFETRKR